MITRETWNCNAWLGGASENSWAATLPSPPILRRNLRLVRSPTRKNSTASSNISKTWKTPKSEKRYAWCDAGFEFAEPQAVDLPRPPSAALVLRWHHNDLAPIDHWDLLGAFPSPQPQTYQLQQDLSSRRIATVPCPASSNQTGISESAYSPFSLSFPQYLN